MQFFRRRRQEDVQCGILREFGAEFPCDFLKELGFLQGMVDNAGFRRRREEEVQYGVDFLQSMVNESSFRRRKQEEVYYGGVQKYSGRSTTL